RACPPRKASSGFSANGEKASPTSSSAMPISRSATSKRRRRSSRTPKPGILRRLWQGDTFDYKFFSRGVRTGGGGKDDESRIGCLHPNDYGPFPVPSQSKADAIQLVFHRPSLIPFASDEVVYVDAPARKAWSSRQANPVGESPRTC